LVSSSVEGLLSGMGSQHGELDKLRKEREDIRVRPSKSRRSDDPRQAGGRVAGAGAVARQNHPPA
jgi:hypothetical protein